MSNDTTGKIVRDESAKQAVILVFSLAGTIATIIIVRYLHDESRLHLAKMQLALWVKRYAQHKSEQWQAIADKAATEFNRLKEW